MNNKITFGIMTVAIAALVSGISTIVLESGIQSVSAQGTPGGTPYGQIVSGFAQTNTPGQGNALSQSIQEYRETDQTGNGIGEIRGNGPDQNQGGGHFTRSEAASGR